MNALIVTNPHNGLAKGDRITDPAEIAKTLAAEHAHDVVQARHADVHHAPPAEETEEIEEA